MSFLVKKEENDKEIVYYISSGKIAIFGIPITIGFSVFYILSSLSIDKIFSFLALGFSMGVIGFAICMIIVYTPLQLVYIRSFWNKKKITTQRLGWFTNKITIEK